MNIYHLITVHFFISSRYICKKIFFRIIIFLSMSHKEFLISGIFGKITYFYDSRSHKKDEIENFLQSDIFVSIEKSLSENIYLSLGGDGLFVFVAKLAHENNVKILGINFWNLGFLVQEKEIFAEKNSQNEKIEFITKKYPIFRTIIELENLEKIVWKAFNEVYLTRSGSASSLSLELFHRGKKLNFRGDGIMISTPAGSTGWSKSYSGIILPHNANLNIVTPIGTISPVNLRSFVVSDKGRITMNIDCSRENSFEILVDNESLYSHQKWKFKITIERDEKMVEVLVAKNFLKKYEAKVYEIQGLSYEQI